jgi:hypothetical protein
MVRLEQLQSVTPRMLHACEVDASATMANRTSQNREKEWNSRSDDSRHLERCKCGLEFSGVMVFIIIFSFFLLELTVLGSRTCGRASIQTGGGVFIDISYSILEESHFLN